MAQDEFACVLRQLMGHGPLVAAVAVVVAGDVDVDVDVADAALSI